MSDAINILDELAEDILIRFTRTGLRQPDIMLVSNDVLLKIEDALNGIAHEWHDMEIAELQHGFRRVIYAYKDTPND